MYRDDFCWTQPLSFEDACPSWPTQNDTVMQEYTAGAHAEGFSQIHHLDGWCNFMTTNSSGKSRRSWASTTNTTTANLLQHQNDGGLWKFFQGGRSFAVELDALHICRLMLLKTQRPCSWFYPCLVDSFLTSMRTSMQTDGATYRCSFLC